MQIVRVGIKFECLILYTSMKLRRVEKNTTRFHWYLRTLQPHLESMSRQRTNLCISTNDGHGADKVPRSAIQRLASAQLISDDVQDVSFDAHLLTIISGQTTINVTCHIVLYVVFSARLF